MLVNGICNRNFQVKKSSQQKKLNFGLSLYDEPDKRREIKEKISNSSGKFGDAVKRVVQTSIGAGAGAYAASTFINDTPIDAGIAAGLSTAAVTSIDFIPFRNIVQRAGTDIYDTVDILEKRGEVYKDSRQIGYTPQLSKQKANTAAIYRLQTIRDVEKAETRQKKDFSETIPVRYNALMAGKTDFGDYIGKSQKPVVTTANSQPIIVLPYTYYGK